MFLIILGPQIRYLIRALELIYPDLSELRLTLVHPLVQTNILWRDHRQPLVPNLLLLEHTLPTLIIRLRGLEIALSPTQLDLVLDILVVHSVEHFLHLVQMQSGVLLLLESAFDEEPQEVGLEPGEIPGRRVEHFLLGLYLASSVRVTDAPKEISFASALLTYYQYEQVLLDFVREHRNHGQVILQQIHSQVIGLCQLAHRGKSHFLGVVDLFALSAELFLHSFAEIIDQFLLVAQHVFLFLVLVAVGTREPFALFLLLLALGLVIQFVFLN